MDKPAQVALREAQWELAAPPAPLIADVITFPAHPREANGIPEDVSPLNRVITTITIRTVVRGKEEVPGNE